MKTRRRVRRGNRFHTFMTEVDGGFYTWGRTTPVGPDEQRWLDEVCTDAHACSIAVQGVDVEAQLLDVSFIGRAAEQLWLASSGAPAWAALDVAAFVALVERRMPSLRLSAIATLWAFIEWMSRTGRLAEVDYRVVMARFEPYVPELFRAACGAPEPPCAPRLPACCRPN